MYTRTIELKNVGPISNCNLTFPFDTDGSPQPVVLVGENGSGKSIFLSFIVNALLTAKGVSFEDSEIEKGKVYKYRSSDYITRGEPYYFGRVTFEEELEVIEWQLDRNRKDFEAKNGMCPGPKWTDIPEHESQYFWSNFQTKEREVRKLYNENCVLYFPPNRFEEPAWLNYQNLMARAEFTHFDLEGKQRLYLRIGK